MTVDNLEVPEITNVLGQRKQQYASNKRLFLSFCLVAFVSTDKRTQFSKYILSIIRITCSVGVKRVFLNE